MKIKVVRVECGVRGREGRGWRRCEINVEGRGITTGESALSSLPLVSHAYIANLYFFFITSLSI